MGRMTKMHVAALQQSFSDDIDTNIDRVETLVRAAAQRGAKVILPGERPQGAGGDEQKSQRRRNKSAE